MREKVCYIHSIIKCIGVKKEKKKEYQALSSFAGLALFTLLCNLCSALSPLHCDPLYARTGAAGENTVRLDSANSGCQGTDFLQHRHMIFYQGANSAAR